MSKMHTNLIGETFEVRMPVNPATLKNAPELLPLPMQKVAGQTGEIVAVYQGAEGDALALVRFPKGRMAEVYLSWTDYYTVQY